ncbi:hypothetical protein D7W81_32130 [Corallococcus aberystwythensis]|uniref:DUF4013 domain-containing protein n=1 Tax=Corallococcus aberystwythensis TaxID=2316722 RepID=A0A3A8PLN3_9BACT|nr:hypothetical protein D7W81_32130 [Corallococcus aberystwythensis]
MFLLTTLPGWILNLGHRLEVVYRIFHDEPPYFRGFRPILFVFKRGLTAWLAIAIYLAPSATCAFAAWLLWPGPWATTLVVVAVAAFALAVFSLPGGMTFNAAFRDVSYLYRPDKAFRRALEGGRVYLKAWVIGGTAVLLSFLGLAVMGIGFLATSVWAWTVVGYAFSRALALSTRASTDSAD